MSDQTKGKYGWYFLGLLVLYATVDWLGNYIASFFS